MSEQITLKLNIRNFNLSEIKTTEEAIETAKRFIENAKEILANNIDKKIPEYYKDSKYVIKACGLLYVSFKIILKGFYLLNPEIIEQELKNNLRPKKKEKLDRVLKFYNLEHITYFGNVLRNLYGKKYIYMFRCNKAFSIIYEIIHEKGYYEGLLGRPIIEYSISLIEKLLQILEQEYRNQEGKR
ncbi:MAG: hypothetical protein KatS3mg129_3073 [Leptospiraceae bacterium]|nr:MAG: hypothetical protein KatS3mg129_3073 [Leptospiraceae bacterium]